MRKNQRVADMADEVLARQARTRADRTGEPFDEALKAILETEAGRQLKELCNGPHHDERAEERAGALGWSSPNKVPGSPTDVPRRGPR